MSKKDNSMLQKPANESSVLSKALIRSATKLELSRQELSKIIGNSEATISRLYTEQTFIQPDSKEGELTLLFIRLFRSLNALLGGNTEQAKLWFRSTNYHLNGVPAELVQSVEGLNKVIIYLDAMRGKL